MSPSVRRILLRHALPAVAVAVFLLPLVFLVAGSLRPSGLPPPQGVELLPPDATLESYRRLDDLLPVWTYLGNSAFVAAIAVPLSVLVASLAGFGIRILDGRWARAVVVGVVVVMLIPGTAVWATRFELFRSVGAVDSYVPLIVLALLGANPFYVLIYAWAFHRVGDEQLDAARLDGAGSVTTWWRVALPQVHAATLAVVVLAFAYHWANFIDPLLYLNSLDAFTYPLGLRFLQQLNPTDFPLLMAGSVVFAIPVVVVLLLAQRWLFDDPRRIVGGERSA